MKIKEIIRIERYLSLIGAAGLLAWWFLMPVLLPVSDSTESFQQMILDNNWVSLNIVGLVSTLLIALGFPGFYLAKHNKLNKTGFIGLMITCVGLILFTAIQYYETFLWPVAARVNPELLEVEGALVSGDAGIVAGLLISGIFLGLGYVLFGISSLKTKSYPKIPIWFLIIGAPVFGNGVLFPVRTVGLVLFCAGTIILSLKTNTMKKQIKIILVAAIIIIAFQPSVHSQWKPKTLNIALISESVSIPFGQIVFSPLHPGISVGTDVMVKDQTSWYRSLGVEAGYYYHKLYEQCHYDRCCLYPWLHF